MENSVKLRELKKRDLPALEDVIRRTWNYDKFATPKTARKLAKVYLADLPDKPNLYADCRSQWRSCGADFGKGYRKAPLSVKIPPTSNIRRMRIADFQRGTRHIEFL